MKLCDKYLPQGPTVEHGWYTGSPSPKIDEDFNEAEIRTALQELNGKSAPGPDRSELIVSKGYPVEEHTVVTADGYILRMQRIPGGRNEPVVLDANYYKPVVLIVHALAVSSADFVINFPEQSLGFVLADAGYDVWLGNLRGNEYTSHLTYKKSDPIFWRFSFDEMIMYDTPSMIDGVLGRTNNTRLMYIGFSQGTQVLFGLLAEQPEYNKKISLFLAMAPIAYLGHLKAISHAFVPFAEVFRAFVWWYTGGSIAVRTPQSTAAAIRICGGTFTVSICLFFVELVNGVDLYQLNVTRLAVYAAHSPSGTSVDNIYHFAQLVRCNCFRKFNHGAVKNLKKYGSVSVYSPK
ncbi:gastric triacylglycerol lipase-like [Dermacentor andersoni]|uniref:gastric triacylglycerol lipase-like n=1 Tax=Dermacentor andersoni TaxID=34620 RepID=UPI003B3BBE50